MNLCRRQPWWPRLLLTVTANVDEAAISCAFAGTSTVNDDGLGNKGFGTARDDSGVALIHPRSVIGQQRIQLQRNLGIHQRILHPTWSSLGLLGNQAWQQHKAGNTHQAATKTVSLFFSRPLMTVSLTWLQPELSSERVADLSLEKGFCILKQV